MFLPPANKVWGKVIFLHLSVILFIGGGVHGGGHAWQWGACVAGGVHGGAYMVGACMAGGMWGVCMGGMHGRGHAWQGGMCGGGACVVGGHVWQILQDTVNVRAVRILLECILVIYVFSYAVSLIKTIVNYCYWQFDWILFYSRIIHLDIFLMLNQRCLKPHQGLIFKSDIKR